MRATNRGQTWNLEDSKGDSYVEPAVAGVVAEEWPLCTGDLESSKPRFEELLRSPFVSLALSDSENALQQGHKMSRGQ